MIMFLRKKNRMRWISMVLAVALCCSMTVGAAGAAQPASYQMEKISHPASPLKTTDGIVDYVGGGVVSADDQGQGDRGQSYAWAAIARGDDVYVSTCYNAMGNTLTLMDSALGLHFEKETMTALLNVLYNGAFYVGEADGGSAGGILVKVNAKTGEVKLLMSKATTNENCLFRNACEYAGKFYFCGSVNALPCIYEVDPETDTCKMVYQGMTLQDYMEGYVAGICTGIRGLCEFNGQLIVSCVTKEGPEILMSTHPWDGQDAFTQIANQQDLFDYPAYHYTDSIYGGSIWEMVNFNGSLYVSICTGTPDNKPDANSMQSFALVRGDQGQDGSWSWTPVIGDKERDGAKYTFGIDPARTRAGAGVLTVYGDYLYIGEYNDEEIALEDVLFDVNFQFVNENLKQSVSLYRMDKEENIELVMGDATEMFPEGGISGYGSGFGQRENQYIWRMTEYDGKLFVGTFDTSSLLEPLGQFANGDINHMSPEEWQQLLQFIRELLKLQNKDGQEENPNTRAARLAELLGQYTDPELANTLSGGAAQRSGLAKDASLQELLQTAKEILTCAYLLKDSVRGFDCYVSEDGEQFERITTDGFGDPFNHGLRVFAVADSGLCIGTANPFYGTQLWMLQEDSDTAECTFASNLDIAFDWQTAEYTLTTAPNTRSFTFTMTPENMEHTIAVNGKQLEGYQASVPLQVGKNTVTVEHRDANGNPLMCYTFNITVPACDQGDTCPSGRFVDLDRNRWYHEGVDYVVSNGIMNGVSGQYFDPDGCVTRGMVVTILYRKAGTPAVKTASPYSDVPTNRYFSEAVSWAAEQGIATGYPDGSFHPNQPVTRQELAAFLYRYAKLAGWETEGGATGDLQGFADADQVLSYAAVPMAWAVHSGLIQGVGDRMLEPAGTASRAMAATILYRATALE